MCIQMTLIVPQYDFSKLLMMFVEFPYKTKCDVLSIYIAVTFIDNLNCTNHVLKLYKIRSQVLICK